MISRRPRGSDRAATPAFLAIFRSCQAGTTQGFRHDIETGTRALDQGKTDMEHQHHSAAAIPEGAPTAIDPVCGMTVAVGPDTRKAQFGGKTFHFC